MKSSLRRSLIKSDLEDSFLSSFSKPKIRRLSTQPQTLSNSYQNNHSLYSNQSSKKLFSRQASLNNQRYEQHKSRNNCQSVSYRSAQRNKFQLTSNMSNRSYDKIIAYGWSNIKVPAQSQNQTFFNINLGRVKNFTIIQTENLGLLGKTIIQEFQIQLLIILEDKNTVLNQQIFNKLIHQSINKVETQGSKISKIFNRLSLLSVVYKQNQIIVFSLGEVNALCFTNKLELLNLSEKGYSQNQQIKKNTKYNNFFRKNTHNYQTQKFTSKNKKYSLLSENLTLGKSQIDQQSKNIVKIRNIASQEVVWLGMFTKNIVKNCTKTFIKQHINKQFSLNSKNYKYNQIASESCNKIINSVIEKNTNCAMTGIIIFMDQYPFKKQTNNIKNLWQAAKMRNRLKALQIQHQQNKPKVFKYLGNRRSFVKSVTPGNTNSEKKVSSCQ